MWNILCHQNIMLKSLWTGAVSVMAEHWSDAASKMHNNSLHALCTIFPEHLICKKKKKIFCTKIYVYIEILLPSKYHPSLASVAKMSFLYRVCGKTYPNTWVTPATPAGRFRHEITVRGFNSAQLNQTRPTHPEREREMGWDGNGGRMERRGLCVCVFVCVWEKVCRRG